jgi:hypothetical protein
MLAQCSGGGGGNDIGPSNPTKYGINNNQTCRDDSICILMVPLPFWERVHMSSPPSSTARCWFYSLPFEIPALHGTRLCLKCRCAVGLFGMVCDNTRYVSSDECELFYVICSTTFGLVCMLVQKDWVSHVGIGFFVFSTLVGLAGILQN